MKSTHSFCLPLLLACGLNVYASESISAEHLVTIFNGKDFTGWELPKQDSHRASWQIENGILKVKNDPQQEGSTLWTKKDYRNFILEFEFRMGKGVVDSGVFLRNSNDQIQIGNSGSLKRDMTASPYIASERGYPVEANGIKKLLRPRDWNGMTIVAKANDYCVWLNGQFVMHYRSKTADEKGPIGLQLHPGREMEIDFRNIRLAELR